MPTPASQPSPPRSGSSSSAADMNKSKRESWVWRRLVPSHALDPWMERLTWVGPERIVSRELPGQRRARVEVYCVNSRQARKLTENYGGEVRRVRADAWIPSQQRKFILALPPHCCIRSPDATPPAKHAGLPIITLPAGMAFGTGEHATTAMCLRRLSSLTPRSLATSSSRKPVRRLLDAGTGSGILALAASLMGYRVDAIDNDPDSIREARKNSRLNAHIQPVRWKLSTVEAFESKHQYDVITANLYLAILAAATTRFVELLSPQGHLIASGIMHHQEEEAREILQKSGLSITERKRTGKWLCFVATAQSNSNSKSTHSPRSASQ